MKLNKTILFVSLACLVLFPATGWSQNLLANSTFATGDLSGWNTFLIQNFGQGAAMTHRASVLGLTAPPPPDAHAAGIELISEANGWRSGLYQVITGVTPGQSYTFEARGQILTSDSGSGAPAIGDDFLTLFWVDGTDTSFTTTWPGSIQNINQIATYTDVWMPISGSFTPTSTTIIVGVVAYFTDPTPVSGGCFTNCIVDDFKLNLTGADFWEIVYDASIFPPTIASPTSQLRIASNNAINPVIQTGGGAENPVGNESYVEYIDSSATDLWDELRSNQTFRAESACTVVARMRRRSPAVGAGDITIYRVRNGVDRFEIQMPASGSDWQWLVNSDGGPGGTDPVVTIGALDTWHTVRLTWALEGSDTRVNVYIDGNLTPATSHLANRTNTNNFFELGGGGAPTGSYDLDWILMTSEGAFAPYDGPALPAGYTEGTPPTPASNNNWPLYR